MDDGVISRVRAIPLAAVLEGLGAERDPSDPTRNWRLGASRITVTGDRFFDHHGAGAAHRLRDGKSGGGGAIDLLMYLRDVPFREAVRELGGWEPQRIAQSGTRPARVPVAQAEGASVVDARLPIPDARMTAAVRDYLTGERAIPAEVVRRAMASGKVFADQFANVVFRLSDETGQEVGYELRGTMRGSTYHGARGEKGLFAPRGATRDGPREAAFVESGIDALSYQALKPGRLVFSTTGNAIERPVAMAQHLIARGYKVYAAFDADTAGDRMAARLAEHLAGQGARDRPDPQLGKDWNAVLQAQRREASVARGRPDRDLEAVAR